jgi:phosphonate transport system substrate-binding protein
MRNYYVLLAVIAAAFASLAIARLGVFRTAGDTVEQTPTIVEADVEIEAAVARLTFGVYQTDKASTVYEKFRPILDALETGVQERTGRPTDIEILILPTYDDGRAALTEGRVDFARFGPASYVIAARESPGIRLLAMEEKKGKKRFNGLIVSRVDSEVESLEDLRGRRFAFGDRNSTIGRYLSQALLVETGINATDLSAYDYLGRHDTVFKAVEIGEFDAGALKESTFKKMNKNGQLRVVASFSNVTKPWLVRAGMDDALVEALSAALRDIQDEASLSALKVSAFVPATPADYAFVRAGMNSSSSFGTTD